jgi:transposase
MRPKGSAKELETRRVIAMRLLKKLGSLNKVASAIGCCASSVMRWRDAQGRHGKAGLKTKPIPGRPSRLSPRQFHRLIEVLLEGAMVCGYSTELWTARRIAEIIHRKFGVCYHRGYVSYLMHRLRWTYQKPERRALERDEEKIARWKRVEWPRIKRGRSGWVPTSSS